MLHALDRQRAIYMKGMSGEKPAVPFHADTLREVARQKMSSTSWAYIDGGAGDESTMRTNLDAFAEVRIHPQMMQDNAAADFSSRLLGLDLKFPLLVAPIGALDMLSTDADLKVAAACRETGTPFVFSNQAGVPMESCAAAMGEVPHWFQLYWSKSDELVLSFVKRAEASGSKAIVLTVDTTLLGWRSRDLSFGYLPFLRGLGIAQYTSDPVFQRLLREGADQFLPSAAPTAKPKVNLTTIANLLRLKSNYPGGLWHNLSRGEALEAVRLFVNIYSNPSLSWEQVRWLRTQTKLPILIKGILRVGDAEKAVEAGADGIIVSNHGGRQVDGAVSSLSALREIRKALPKPFPVLMDSGIRSGSDLFKALALGADAILLGRPYAYGLAVAGQSGVASVINNICNDFELTARLSGCRNLNEIADNRIISDNRIK